MVAAWQRQRACRCACAFMTTTGGPAGEIANRNWLAAYRDENVLCRVVCGTGTSALLAPGIYGHLGAYSRRPVQLNTLHEPFLLQSIQRLWLTSHHSTVEVRTDDAQAPELRITEGTMTSTASAPPTPTARMPGPPTFTVCRPDHHASREGRSSRARSRVDDPGPSFRNRPPYLAPTGRESQTPPPRSASWQDRHKATLPAQHSSLSALRTHNTVSWSDRPVPFTTNCSGPTTRHRSAVVDTKCVMACMTTGILSAQQLTESDGTSNTVHRDTSGAADLKALETTRRTA
jgi:hypothetical protein